ncbi:MAG TPA: acyl-[ACP]--phospholipid O-acyltransferase [Planctomycetota bacterium]|nr:acyl-[ACP]--phospholipid O-acyltransferase [Planctomycetota bacterium]
MGEPSARSDTKSYAGLVFAQALGTFNDNFFRAFLIFVALSGVEREGDAGSQANLKVRLTVVATLLFIAPFVLFSAHAGWLADAFSKRRVVVLLKSAEVFLMAAIAGGLYVGSYPLLAGLLFLLSAQSAFFSPAKYGLLPELLAPAHLARGNGILELTNFLSIILGTVAAGQCFQFFHPHLHRAGWLLMALSLVGLLASLVIRRVPAAAPGLPFHWNPFAGLASGLRAVFPDRTLRLTTVGVAYFWSLGCILQNNLIFYGDLILKLDESRLSLLNGAVALGIGVGSVFAGFLSRRRVELGLVPIGSFGMAIFSILLLWTPRWGEGHWPFYWTFASFLLLGIAGGFFIVPLQTLLQQEALPEQKGTVLAFANFLAFSGMLFALGALWLLLNTFNFDPGQVFCIVGAATIAGTIYVLTLLPQQMFRLVFWVVTNTIYRVRVVGAENLPLHGPALIVANHVSFADGLLILASTHRSIRFIVYKGIAQLPIFRTLSRIMRVIPISAEEGPRAIISALRDAAAALEAGELVCIFAEGQISRTGQMLPFRAGTERILKDVRAPVIPVHLDQVWGSIFSFSGRKFFWKLPLRLPYPVTVSFGRPMPPDTPIEEIRQAVQELGSAAFELRKKRQRPLAWNFFRFARRHPWTFAVVDSTGRRASFGKLAASVTHLARILRRTLAGEENAGLLLPPSVAGVAVNAAVTLLGKPAVNLNYTSSAESIRSALEQTKIRIVVTSRAFLEKIKLEVPARLVFVEDFASMHGGFLKTLDALAAMILPMPILRWWVGGVRVRMDDIATVIFSSGSTGEPKGVLQTHFNILSNIQSVAQLMQLGPRERVLAVLPFFHSTGYTCGLWAPLLTGMGAVYHPQPLDARTVGALAKEHGVTILFATPTFLNAYARRCEPADFGSVTYVIAGAEKLTQQIADHFTQRFGIEPMEGYGCTEASPMVAVNVPDYRGRGVFQVGGKRGTVGHPLPGVSVRIVDPESGALLDSGKSGLLLVKGPNIMKGYLDKPELTAEVLRDGWYKTGDIALVDEDGFIAITDRLSRFSKIAGEMVPHVKVEEALNNALGQPEPAFFVTSVPSGTKGERLAVVHTLDDEKIAELFAKLPAQGLPNLWTPKQDSFVRVQEIPRLGTGKVDLKALRQIAVAALAPERSTAS